MIEYTIDKNGIIRVVFTGEVEFAAIIKWLAIFSEITNLPDHLGLIYDLRNAKFDLDRYTLMHIVEHSERATQKYKSIRTAFLINDSRLENYKSFFTFLKENKHTTRKAYSRFDDAYQWLNGGKGDNSALG